MTELLSPAGSWDSLVAAVQTGADAVYMGFGAFNARRNAQNFSEEDFAAAVNYCHLRGVKVYLTLNTLINDRELPSVADTMRKASRYGVDAILIQDLGVFTLAQEVIPDVALHASTQMSIFTLGGANYAASLGMERVVLARELSGKEIAEICQGCPAEIEAFVHGALCMCYSGQCALSALIGTRSGNRGTCAQPCRLPYGVNEPCRGKHPLSLKDANLSSYLQEMDEMGVACLKIEGRMKRPEYVAVVTSIYRRLLDEKRKPMQKEIAALEEAFSRSGFTEGYYLGQKGSKMFGTRPENVAEPKELFSEIKTSYERETLRRVKITMSCTMHRDESCRLSVSDGQHSCTVYGPVPELARNRALTSEDLQDRLGKTGGTVYTPVSVDVQLDDGLMLAASAINALRRNALSQLDTLRTVTPERKINMEQNLPEAPANSSSIAYTCSIQKPEQLTSALLECRPEIVYIPYEILDKVDLTAYADKTEFCVVLPRIYRTKDEKAFRDKLISTPGISSVSISNIGHLPIVEGLHLKKRGDFGLNVFNSRTIRFLSSRSFESVTVSFELRHQQIRDLKKYLPCEAIVYGRLPLMVMENCVIHNNVGCNCQQENNLNDRTGASFPLLSVYGCRNEIENSTPLYLADKLEYKQLGLSYARLRFTTESPDACVEIFKSYLSNSTKTPENYTRGLFYRGVE